MGTPAKLKPNLRFGAFELDANTRELHTDGRILKLQEQPFQLLIALLERPGQLITRDELKDRLWPADTFVDFEHSINKAMNRLREILGDSAGQPQYIETLPRLGYRLIVPVETSDRPTVLNDVTTPTAPTMLRSRWLWTVIVLGAMFAWFAWFARPVPPPRILNTTQITHDGVAKRNVLTDGSRLYIVEDKAYHPYLIQASVVGGDTSVIPTPFANANFFPTAISPDRSHLLALSFIGTQIQAQFWTLPVPTGTARPLTDVVGHFGTWSPDGRLLAFAKGSEIFVANADGTNPRKVSTVSGLASRMRFSPDATRLRFTLQDSASRSIWEVHVDGSGLCPLLPGWHTPPAECCGEWSSDGRYYFFVSDSSGISNIFALREQRRFFTRRSEPLQLTTGPLSLPFFVPSPDNKKIFADGQSLRGELVRYDNHHHQFLPFFAGIWAGEMDFSGDGKWVAYVSYEDHSLWRARVDGSERLQLTSPPVYAFLPRWSPDGTRIVYTDFQSGPGPVKIFLVSANGGKPQRMFTESQDQIDPSWSPDGKQVVYGRSWSTPEKLSIQMLDLESNRVSTIPGSGGLYSPRWSPDGRHLAAMSADAKKLLLFDFKMQKWTNWIDEPGALGFPTWSRDGKYIYYDTTSTEHTAFRRIEVGRTQSEFLIDLRELHRFAGGSSWSGLTPDGTALFVRDLSTDEIYSLEMDLP